MTRSKARQTKKALVPWLFLLPAVVFLATFLLYPLLLPTSYRVSGCGSIHFFVLHFILQ